MWLSVVVNRWSCTSCVARVRSTYSLLCIEVGRYCYTCMKNFLWVRSTLWNSVESLWTVHEQQEGGFGRIASFACTPLEFWVEKMRNGEEQQEQMGPMMSPSRFSCNVCGKSKKNCNDLMLGYQATVTTQDLPVGCRIFLYFGVTAMGHADSSPFPL